MNCLKCDTELICKNKLCTNKYITLYCNHCDKFYRIKKEEYTKSIKSFDPWLRNPNAYSDGYY